MRLLSVPDSPTVFGSISISHTTSGSANQAEAGSGIPSAEGDTYTSWEALWGSLGFTGAVDENGTVIRTMSGSANIANPESMGSAMFSVNVAFQPGVYAPGDLQKTIEMLAGAYKVTAAAIRCAETGESLFKGSSERNRLELVYQERKTEVSDSFSEMVGGYLEACSETGQEIQKVRDSVQALFTSYEEKYQTVIEKIPQSVWMGGSLFASIVNLQKLGASFQSGGETKKFYSLQELEAAALRVSKGFSIHG